MTLDRGTLILVDLEPSLGHEQQGTRPCVVLSDAAVNSSQRFPLIAGVPVTATPATGALYPSLARGQAASPNHPPPWHTSCRVRSSLMSVVKEKDPIAADWIHSR